MFRTTVTALLGILLKRKHYCCSASASCLRISSSKRSLSRSRARIFASTSFSSNLGSLKVLWVGSGVSERLLLLAIVPLPLLTVEACSRSRACLTASGSEPPAQVTSIPSNVSFPDESISATAAVSVLSAIIAVPAFNFGLADILPDMTIDSTLDCLMGSFCTIASLSSSKAGCCFLCHLSRTVVSSGPSAFSAARCFSACCCSRTSCALMSSSCFCSFALRRRSPSCLSRSSSAFSRLTSSRSSRLAVLYAFSRASRSSAKPLRLESRALKRSARACRALKILS